MQEYLDMWRNYINFTDRTTVRGYWMAVLVNALVILLLIILARLAPQLFVLAQLYILAVFIPKLAIIVHRLRDAGRSWGWILIGLIPWVGTIVLVVLLCGRSVNSLSDIRR